MIKIIEVEVFVCCVQHSHGNIRQHAVVMVIFGIYEIECRNTVCGMLIHI